MRSRLPLICLTLLLGSLATGCATLSPGGRVVAHSRLGDVTATELDRFLRELGLEVSVPSPAVRRRQIEDLLVVRATEAEALLLPPAAASALRVDLALREEEILAGERRARLEVAARASVAVSEAEVTAAVAAHLAARPGAERLRLRQIFKRTPAHASAEERRSIAEEMRAIRGEVLAGGDFRLLARQRSDSQTAVFDGLVAPLALPDLEPALSGPLALLEVGEVSEVLVTSTGLHLFRLEERLPAPPPPDTTALAAAVRADLEQRAVAAAIRHAFDDLLLGSGADFHPERLEQPGAAPDDLLFALAGRAIRLGEIQARWRSLAFIERRTTSLRSLLEADVGRALLLHAARREGLASEPGPAARLERARQAALFVSARKRRLAELAANLPEEELAAYFVREKALFERPERRRLRGLLVPIAVPAAANALFDDLDLVARRVRAGEADLALEARRLSHDPSRFEDGDLGWVEERELALWAGPRLPGALFALPVGLVSAPLLVEAYDDRRLRDEPIAYLVARVEAVEPASDADFATLRAEVMEQFLVSRAPVIGRDLRADYLDELGLVILDAPR